MSPTAIQSATAARYLPIPLDTLRVDTILAFDLFIRIKRNFVLYRSADLPFNDGTRRKLLENRVERLYIKSDSRQKYQRYLEGNLGKILADPDVRDEKKATVLYETSTNLVKEVLANPTYGDNIRRSKDLVANTLEYILKGREAFLNLLKITSFDYYTYTHSVNVCTFSIALAQQMGFDDEEFLHELGVGALLHDIGKSRVSERILKKQTTLNTIEFEIMKKHPKWGVDILTETDQIAANSYYPVLQHHERGNRNGYPDGLSLDEMHVYSRIAAIADSFDAMTTERVYQKAMESFPALRIMCSMKEAFEKKLLAAFVELMGPTGLADI
jgi:putative nucleotidyltransferase with HDIG domain